jgi:hypothetical protein
MNGVIILRSIYLGVAGQVTLFPVAMSFLDHDKGETSAEIPWAVVPIGIVTLACITRLRRRPLRTTTPAELAGSYRGLFFLGIGFAAIPVLCAVGLSFFSTSFWTCLIGLPFSIVGMWLVAPSRSDIKRRQRDITAAGSPLSLLDALISAPPSRP